MIELAHLQQRFKQAVTAPASEAQAVDDLLRAPPGARPLLSLYRHAYTSRLVGALRDNFGVLPQLMGDEAFEHLAQAYVQAHPSRHPSIRWFGDQLPDFMTHREDLVPHLALVDVARMEWALRGAFDAADAPILSATELAALPPTAWGDLSLVFHPSVCTLSLKWRVEPLWRALQNVEPGHEPELPEPQPDAHTLLVWRPVRDTRWRSAHSALEAALLSAAMAGEPIALLCEQTAAALGVDQAALAAVTALQQWVGEGLLTAVRHAGAKQ